jgi:hypothetical protein
MIASVEIQRGIERNDDTPPFAASPHAREAAVFVVQDGHMAARVRASLDYLVERVHLSLVAP